MKLKQTELLLSEMRRIAVLTMSIGVMTVVSGCTIAQKHTASVPDLQGTGIFFMEHRQHIMKLSDLELSVKPFNTRLVSVINSWFLFIPLPFRVVYPEAQRFEKRGDSAAPPFLLEIAFHPKASLSVDPSQVTLTLRGQGYRPTLMVGPSEFSPMTSFGGRSYQGLNLCSMRSDLRWEDQMKAVERIEIAAGEMACMWLLYNVAPPPPEIMYSLSINGVELEKQPLMIPSIRLVKGTAYANDSIP